MRAQWQAACGLPWLLCYCVCGPALMGIGGSLSAIQQTRKSNLICIHARFPESTLSFIYRRRHRTSYMSGLEMIGAGGGGGQDFQLTKLASSVLEFQGSIRAILNRDAGEMPRRWRNKCPSHTYGFSRPQLS